MLITIAWIFALSVAIAEFVNEVIRRKPNFFHLAVFTLNLLAIIYITSTL